MITNEVCETLRICRNEEVKKMGFFNCDLLSIRNYL